MADSKVLDRVRKFINLAAGTGAEAEAAAWKACALIRQYGLDVINPVELNTTYDELAAAKNRVKELEAARVTATDPDDDLHTVLNPSWAANPFAARTPAQPGHTARVYTAPGPPTPSNYVPFVYGAPVQATAAPPQQQPPMTAPRHVAASKFNGKCSHCGKALAQGEPILWQKAVGVWCPTTSCYQDWAALKNINFTP